MFHSDSPYDETCDDSSPRDTAGIRPFGVFTFVLLAAAQADQVHTKDQQAETQTHRTNTRQKYQRLAKKNGERKDVEDTVIVTFKIKTFQ